MPAKRSSTRDLLAKLVAFDTTSRNSNLELIAFIEHYLGQHGIASSRVDYENGRKANLHATIGPAIGGGIVLSGHTDVVPVDGQAWDTDPFTATEKDGAIFGRGAADMKGFLASCLAAVPHLVGRTLKRPIHLAFSCDEEVGCRGVRPLIDVLAERIPPPVAVIVGEPTFMRVVTAHKTALSFETEITGHETHSSVTHRGVNAIVVAGRIIAEIDAIAEEKRRGAERGSTFDPPYTTAHVGLISGGTAKNIVPGHCKFVWETRVLPGEDVDEIPRRVATFSHSLLPEMRKVGPRSGIETRRTNLVPGLAPAPDSPALSIALKLAQTNATGGVSYATEAGFFQNAGFPTVICGPGSIEQAHGANEFITIAELDRCDAFMMRLADYCAGEPPSTSAASNS